MWSTCREFTVHNNALQAINSLAICRLCMLNSGSMMEPIFHPSTAGCVADKITNITRLTLRQGDGLPALVCQQCIFQLDVADKFIQRCTLSDKYLRSILLQGQNKCASEENTGEFMNQVVDPLTTSGNHVETRDDAAALDKDAEIQDLEISYGAPSFEAVDPLALPEHVILNNGTTEEDAKLIMGLPHFSMPDANLGRNLSPSNPLIFVKQENTLEAVPCEENEEGTDPVKIEGPDGEPSLDHTSDDLFYKNSDSEDNVMTEGFNCLSIHADVNQAGMQNAHNSAINSEAGREHDTSSPSNQIRFQPYAKKHRCPICFILLSSRFSVTRHVKIHRRKEICEKRRLARKNAIPHSKRVGTLQDKSSNVKDLDTLQGANSTRSLLVGEEVSSLTTPARNTGCLLGSSCLTTDQLSMTPIVRVAKLVITEDTIQNIVNSFKHSKSKQHQTYSFSQSLTNQKLSGRMNTHGNVSCKIQKSTENCPHFLGGTLCQEFNSSYVAQTKKAAETEIEWDYQKKVSSNDKPRSKICHVCNLVCRDNCRLKIHMRSHTGERPFQCVHCNKGYQTLFSLNRHMKEHTEDREFKCQKCRSSFNTTYQMKCHQAMHTGIRRPRKCLDCGKTFANNYSLKVHSLVHSTARPWKCGQCDSLFKRRYDLRKHQRLLHNVTCKNNSVESSTKQFQSNNESHKKNKLNSKLQEYISNSLVQQNSRKQTPKKRHLNDKTLFGPFQCETCGKAFTKRRYLLRHAICHTREKLWMCGICGLPYNYRNSLVKHAQRHHPNQKFRAIEFPTKPNLEKFAQSLKENFSADAVSVAPGTKTVVPLLVGNTKKRKGSMKVQDLSPYKCSACGKDFRTISILKQHYLTHSAERPWKCDQCDFAFKRRDCLTRHVKLRKHESSIRAMVLEPALRLPISAIPGENTLEILHQIEVPTNPEDMTYELTELTTQKGSETSAKDNLATNSELYKEIYRFPGSSPQQEVIENLDKIKIDNDINESSHHYLYLSQVATENPDDFSAEPFGTTITECSPQSYRPSNDLLVKHTETHCKMDESSHKDPSPTQEIIETLDNIISEALEPTFAEFTVKKKPNVLAKYDFAKLKGMFQKIQNDPSPLLEVAEIPNEICAEVIEPIITEFPLQIFPHFGTNNIAKHPEPPPCKEMDKSSQMDLFPLQDLTAHSEVLRIEAHNHNNAECYHIVQSNTSPKKNIVKTPLTNKKINKSSQMELSPSQDVTENTDFIKTEAHEPIDSECSMGYSMSDILVKDHEIHDDPGESCRSELLLLQKDASTTPAISVIDSEIHDPIMIKNSVDRINSCHKQQLRLVPKKLLKKIYTANETDTFVNDISSPTSQQQAIGNNQKSCIGSVLKSPPLERHHLSLLHCKHCGKGYRHLHGLIKHMGCHSRKHSFHCSHCDALFYRKCHLRDHINSHSAIKWQKCQTCLIKFKSDFDLKAHALSHSEQTASTITPQSETITSQGSGKKEIGTAYQKDPDVSQAKISFEASAWCTELQYRDTENHKNENIDPPLLLKCLLESSPRSRLNEQLSQVDATKMDTFGAPLDYERTCLFTEVIAENHVNIANPLKMQLSARNSDCFMDDIFPQERDTNVNCHIEECNREMPVQIKPEGEESQSKREMSNNQTANLIKMENVDKYSHQTNISEKESFDHITKIMGSEANISIGEKINYSSKIHLKHSGALKNRVSVPLHTDRNINKVLAKNNASPITYSSETAEVRAPQFIFAFLGTEFDYQQSSIQCKHSPDKKQDFHCKSCGKSFKEKRYLAKHCKQFRGSCGKNFVCQGCHKSFNVTGSLGCNCLALL